MNNEKKQKNINSDELINRLPSTGIIEFFIYRSIMDLSEKKTWRRNCIPR